MTSQIEASSSSASALHAIGGTVLLAIAGMCFANLNEDPQTFMILTAAFAASGLYLLIAGAVARGIELARR